MRQVIMFNHHRRAVGTFPTLAIADLALDQLILAGFPIAKVFLVGKNLVSGQSRDSVQMCNLVNQARAGAITGTTIGLRKGLMLGNVLGGTTGMLLGLGIWALPGIGQVTLMGTFIFMICSSSVGTAAGGLIGALVGLGITEKQAREYEQRLAQGEYLLIVDGTKEEIERAQQILKFKVYRSNKGKRG